MTAWKCPNGCPVTHEPCPHLERLLPRLKRDKILTLGDAVERISDSTSSPKHSGSLKRVEKWLKRVGLKAYEIQLVLQRAVDSHSFEDIYKGTSKENGWAHPEAPAYHYKQVMEKLRRIKGVKKK